MLGGKYGSRYEISRSLMSKWQPPQKVVTTILINANVYYQKMLHSLYIALVLIYKYCPNCLRLSRVTWKSFDLEEENLIGYISNSKNKCYPEVLSI